MTWEEHVTDADSKRVEQLRGYGNELTNIKAQDGEEGKRTAESVGSV